MTKEEFLRLVHQKRGTADPNLEPIESVISPPAQPEIPTTLGPKEPHPDAILGDTSLVDDLFSNMSGSEISILIMMFLIGAFAYFNCILNKKISSTTKGVWVIAICIIPIFGAVGYLIGGRKEC